jgi:hypothetical protein
MAKSYKVLLLGSSGLTHTDSGPSGAPSALLAAELKHRAPGVEWVCDAATVAPTRNMADRVAAVVERERPDVVLLAPAGTYFTYDYVVVRLRRIAPRLYDRALWLSRRMKRWAGGGFEGSKSPRGWIFRLPRWLGARLLGMEPHMKVEHAIENTSEALGYLVKQEDVVTLFKLPTISTELSGKRAAEAGLRLNQFHSAMESRCRAHHVPCYELREAYGTEGANLAKGRDGAHWPLEIRKWEAGYLAGLILESLGIEEQAGAGRLTRIEAQSSA